MLSEENQTNPLSESYIFKNNDPLLLDNPETIWLVKSGSLAIFAINFQHGIPKGRRRYLFSVKAGAAMFSAQLNSPNGHYQILAVALEETELLQITKSEFSPTSTPELIENWVQLLSSSVAEIISPKIPTPANIPGCTILGEKEIFQAPHDMVVWAQILQGKGNLLGLDSLEITSEIGRIPLYGYLWLQAQDVIEIDAVSTTDLADTHTLLTGLHHLQIFVLQAISQLEQQANTAELARFQARERLNNQAIASTLGNFANIFDADTTPTSPTKPAIDSEEALLFATGAVAKVLDISIRPPANSEDLRRVRDPLDAIARASRIRIRRITLRDNWWQQDSGALLAYTVADNRPVALLPISETRYEIIDPIEQKRIKCDRQIAATISPTAYIFYRPLPANLKVLNLIQFAFKGRSKELATILFTGIAIALLGMITPQATAILIDQAIPDADKSLLYQIAFGLVATTLGATLFQLTQGVAIMRLETFADTSTQAAIWDKLLNLKASFFRQYSIGDLSARVAVISQIRQKLSNTLLKTLFSSFFSLLNLGLLFYYSPSLALIAVFVALINIAVTIISGILTIRKVRPLLEMQGKLFGMMVQIINGVAKFRTNGAQPRAFAYWGGQYRQQLRYMLDAQSIEDNLVVVNNLLSALTPVIIFAFATNLLQQSQAHGGTFSTGTFLAFNAAFGTFISGATSLSSTAVDILEALPLWERAQPILQATPEVDGSKTDPGRLSGRVEISHVIFRYRPDGALTLDDVSLRAEPGEFIALVGPSGSGKSTLFRLLLGFDTPESGSINYDGQELSGLDVNAVRRQLGVVLQNSRLMSASIFENISSNAVISMEEAWEAARMAGLADDIATMPMGMHTVVSEGGTNLSGGQRQRLLIARALALRPRILVFDEATSALDNRTQAIVSESLEKLNVTRIVVAHRLSTIRNADRIYVLENGRLVQQGNFDQLAQQPGLFSQLIQRQRL
ncbi:MULTISPECIES: NHLP bacteriocin export ABC transporter permease/ATPase subunit [Calothrix]|uniref:NHLP bacteriocin export ABC transporter permease/ATPase subunit n=2 Tax=Calothrix TaxID=1186 RepID=A0ABR8AHI7_9CYAN|nr:MULTISPECIES: NHLP bacteriocin export ABC transporter permease/ATPase subunit [Calothrix]MBD2199408.1 NHLP bacteriocin export ABC transporter permease/ATPase subunit [Calothrix parietina FACHB-288]MBD2228209.1 NHLP bacteriocin export ABC transporter permease/ATPase subunit [Calothrix anomala FACHB-343]